MHGWWSYLEVNPTTNPDEPGFHEMSHGESFLAVLETRFDTGGSYCLDEPEAPLSFSSTFGLIAVLQGVVAVWKRFLDAPQRYLRHLED